MANDDAGSSDKTRTGMLSVRLAPDERESVRRIASERGVSVSEVIRQAVLDECRCGSVDESIFQANRTSTAGGVVLEAHNGQLVPRLTGGTAYVSLH